jgi:two-component system response regulator (stage 0 sporulation protein A)
MLVEDDPKVCGEFRDAMEGYLSMTLTYVTDSEYQALDYLETHPVDIMILDIELAEGDGVSLMTQLGERALEKPFIFVVTNTQSIVTLNCLRAQGVDYIYQKSNRAYSAKRVLCIIDKIYPYQQLENDRQMNHVLADYDQKKADEIALQYIENKLEQMGFQRRHVGFCYVAEAIFLLSRDKEGTLHVSSEIYPLLAEKHHTTKDGVERGIRNAVESVFTSGNMRRLQTHYPFPYDEEKGRPSNAEFLKHMASRLQF